MVETKGVLAHLGLCELIARRHRALLADSALSPDDLFQEAVIGVINGVNSKSFDPKQGQESTFVGACVTNRFRNLRKASRCGCRRERPWSLDEVTHPPRVAGKSEAAVELVGRREVNPADYVQHEEERDRALEEINCVASLVRSTGQSERNQTAFLLRYGLCWPGRCFTCPDLMLLLGFNTRQRVGQVIKRIWQAIIPSLGLPNWQYADMWLREEVRRLKAIEEYLAQAA